MTWRHADLYHAETIQYSGGRQQKRLPSQLITRLPQYRAKSSVCTLIVHVQTSRFLTATAVRADVRPSAYASSVVFYFGSYRSESHARRGFANKQLINNHMVID